MLLPCRYSHTSCRAREIGYRLLAMSTIYEGLAGEDRVAVTTVALVIRSRRLLSGAYHLADHGRALEAAHLLRAMAEAVITLAWLERDQELNFLRWLIDGNKRLLSHDRALRELEKKRRANEGLPPATAADEPLGLLNPEMRKRIETALAERRAELRKVERLEERLEPPSPRNSQPAVKRAESVPSLRQMAERAEVLIVYDVAYRWYSNSAAHASSNAVEQLLVPGVESGAAIASSPIGPIPDPYAVGAALLGMMLDVGGKIVETLKLDRLEEIKRELVALKPFRVDERT